MCTFISLEFDISLKIGTLQAVTVTKFVVFTIRKRTKIDVGMTIRLLLIQRKALPDLEMFVYFITYWTNVPRLRPRGYSMINLVTRQLNYGWVLWIDHSSKEALRCHSIAKLSYTWTYLIIRLVKANRAPLYNVLPIE